MGDSPEDEPGEILNRHAANLRGLALAERQDGDRATNDDIGAAVKPAVFDRDGDRVSGRGRFACRDHFLAKLRTVPAAGFHQGFSLRPSIRTPVGHEWARVVHRQLWPISCVNTGDDTPAVANFAARIRMLDRVIASASLALSNLPDDNNNRHALLRASIDSTAEDTTADLMPLEVPQQGLQHVQEGPGDRPALPLAWLPVPGAPGARVGGNAGIGVATQWLGTNE